MWQKCEVFWPSGDQSFSEFPPEVIRIDTTMDGAEFLGSPICGAETFFYESISKRVNNIRLPKQVDRLKEPTGGTPFAALMPFVV